MRKMNGFAVAAPVMEYFPSDLYENFEDLHKETESMRKKLQMMKERRSTLLAEVKFLKRRHKFLMKSKSTNTPVGRHFLQPQNMVNEGKSSMTAKKKSTGKGSSVGGAMGKTKSVKGTSFTNPSLLFDLNQKQQKVFIGREEPTLRSSLSVLHLNQKERLHSRKEAAARSMKPVFDLNQISREEEELQAQTNSLRTDDFKNNDVKILACRNTGNGPNRTGKRKISWQDQVAALRV